MSAFAIIVAIIVFLINWCFFSWVVRTGNRIAAATEATNLALQTIYDAASPEAKQRAVEVAHSREEQRRAHALLVEKRVFWLVVAVGGFIAFSYRMGISVH